MDIYWRAGGVDWSPLDSIRLGSRCEVHLSRTCVPSGTRLSAAGPLACTRRRHRAQRSAAACGSGLVPSVCFGRIPQADRVEKHRPHRDRSAQARPGRPMPSLVQFARGLAGSRARGLAGSRGRGVADAWAHGRAASPTGGLARGLAVSRVRGDGPRVRGSGPRVRVLTGARLRAAPGSRLPAPGSRLPAPGSRLPAPGSEDGTLERPGPLFHHCGLVCGQSATPPLIRIRGLFTTRMVSAIGYVTNVTHWPARALPLSK